MSVLELTDVHAGYGPYKALTGVTLSVQSGDAVALLGSNGVGKSTLVRVASGLVPTSQGQVCVLGRDIRGESVHALARRGVVHLPEGVGLFGDLSIEENLLLRLRRVPAPTRRRRLAEALEALGPLGSRRRTKARLLSGGQQRLVAVTGALAAQPTLLLADEPALGLSPAAADEVYAALERVRSTDTTLIIVETRLGRVENLCDRAVVLSSGRVAYDGPTSGAQDVLTGLIQRQPE